MNAIYGSPKDNSVAEKFDVTDSSRSVRPITLMSRLLTPLNKAQWRDVKITCHKFCARDICTKEIVGKMEKRL